MHEYCQAISDKRVVKKAEKYLKRHHDEVYWLIWRIGIETGLRITDITNITKLSYDNINFESGEVTVIESKGTLARQARARHKVLKSVKNELLNYYKRDHAKLLSVYVCDYRNIVDLVPRSWKHSIEVRLAEATKSAPVKKRVAYLSSRTLTALKKRRKLWQGKDSGLIFSRATLASNRAKKQHGVISRQACWRVFSCLSCCIEELRQHKIGCHSLRKIFARHLYHSSDMDIGLVATIIGHQSVSTTLRYIGISDEDTKRAQLRLFDYFFA
ncbi:tyrosine-type recombinase/integrase [Vibrio campbellii]|uniref:tyrosine-type recombinase/integrase n=1 Tax=Vibrio campbellii TaxID=680 RepID=UPI00210DDAAA|nr:tyrosine-type recombinase/integrase [Vibrio campbellii]UTZ43535.1 tyrosine-type recombinase/integrase [Vibrio campbellii]